MEEISRAGKPKSKNKKKFTRTPTLGELKSIQNLESNLQMYGILDSNSFLIMTVCRGPFSISL